jgi:hypothetical protein
MLWHIFAVAFASAALAGGSAWRVQEWRHAAINAEALEVVAEASRLRQQAATRNAERNDHATNQALARAHAAALGARGDLERLRIAAAAVAPDPAASAAGCSDDGRLGRLARLLTEGADLVEEGGRRVEQLAAEKAALQRHAADEQ